MPLTSWLLARYAAVAGPNQVVGPQSTAVGVEYRFTVPEPVGGDYAARITDDFLREPVYGTAPFTIP